MAKKKRSTVQQKSSSGTARHDDFQENEPLIEPRGSVTPPIGTGKPDIGQAFANHVSNHKMAQTQLHTLARELPIEKRLAGLQKGECLHTASKRASVLQGQHLLKPGARPQPIDFEAMNEMGDYEFRDGDVNPEDYTHNLPVQEEEMDEEAEKLAQQQYFLESFNRAICDETRSADIPHGTSIPNCECNRPCSLRRQHDDHLSKALMWVCPRGGCMFWSIMTKSERQDNNIINPRFSEKVRTVVAEKSSVGGNGDPESPSRRPYDEYEQDENEINISNLIKIPDKADAAQFWAGVTDIMARPDADTTRLVIGHAPIRNCVCGVPCSISLCKVTGDIFWCCSTQKCFYLLFSQRRSDMAEMDIGQIVKLGDSTIDRYTTLAMAMRWFGYSYSEKFWKYLMGSGKEADFPEGSHQIEPGEEYDGFISYRGASGRLAIQLTLCGQFNQRPALWFLFVVCPILVALISCIPDPCGWDHYDSIQWLTWQNNCGTNLDGSPVIEPGRRSWFIFACYGPIIVSFIVLFWNPVFSWASRKHKFFLDKYCIHQSDFDDRCPAGINRLPLFLSKSNTLYCLFDIEWVTRLWCVWELAVFLRTRENPKIIFASITRHQLEIFVIVVSMFFQLIVDSIQNIVESDKMNDNINDPTHRLSWEISSWAAMVWGVSITTLCFWLGEKHFRAVRELREKLSNYDVRTAQLAVKADKEFLLRIVNELFRNDSEIVQGNMRASTPMIRDRARNSSQSANNIAAESTFTEVEVVEETTEDEEYAGVKAFNAAVRKYVPAQLPVDGVRSWKLLSYTTAILTIDNRDVVRHFDIWAYPPDPVFEAGFWTAFRAVCAIAWKIFVLHALNAFILSLFVKTALSAHAYSGLPKWCGWVIFFPLLVLCENIFGMRYWFIEQFKQLCVYGVIAGNLQKQGTVYFENSGFVLSWMPFYGLGWILPTYTNGSDSFWVKGVSYHFDPNWFVQLLIWLFMVLPATVFVWWIYEPEWSVYYRGVYTDRLVDWWNNRKQHKKKGRTSSDGELSITEVESAA